jgi:hypothetical protein
MAALHGARLTLGARRREQCNSGQEYRKRSGCRRNDSSESSIWQRVGWGKVSHRRSCACSTTWSHRSARGLLPLDSTMAPSVKRDTIIQTLSRNRSRQQRPWCCGRWSPWPATSSLRLHSRACCRREAGGDGASLAHAHVRTQRRRCLGTCGKEEGLVAILLPKRQHP